ncbi:MAG TPA: nuclear transport factor 2 family protein [Polyangiaceae bacterium]|nr:nuclear transport factor 2 family protein [Polyangiaceae bacterium]
MPDSMHEILTLGQRWAEAEQRGDVAVLDAMTTPDFELVGPLGFVLNKEQWLERYRSGALRTESLAWNDVSVRDYGQLALAVGVQNQQAAYNGRSASGSFRVTQMFARLETGWKLAGIHLSPMPPTAALLVSAFKGAS